MADSFLTAHDSSDLLKTKRISAEHEMGIVFAYGILHMHICAVIYSRTNSARWCAAAAVAASEMKCKTCNARCALCT